MSENANESGPGANSSPNAENGNVEDAVFVDVATSAAENGAAESPLIPGPVTAHQERHPSPPTPLPVPGRGEQSTELLVSSGAPCPGDGDQEIPEIEVEPVKKTGKRGRPAVMDETMKLKACTLLEVGLSRRQVGTYLDISPTTITNTMDRDEEFAAQVERSEELSVINPMITIGYASQKNWRAAVWLLTRNEQRLARIEAAAKGQPSEEERRAAHEERLRQAREFNEWSAVIMSRETTKSPGDPVPKDNVPHFWAEMPRGDLVDWDDEDEFDGEDEFDDEDDEDRD